MADIDWNVPANITRDNLIKLTEPANITNSVCIEKIIDEISMIGYRWEGDLLNAKGKIIDNVLENLKTNFESNFGVWDYALNFPNNIEFWRCLNENNWKQFLNNFPKNELTNSNFFKTDLKRKLNYLETFNTELQTLFEDEFHAFDKALGMEVEGIFAYKLAEKLKEMTYKYKLEPDKIVELLKEQGTDIYYLLPYHSAYQSCEESFKFLDRFYDNGNGDGIYPFIEAAMFKEIDPDDFIDSNEIDDIPEKEINFLVLQILNDFYEMNNSDLFVDVAITYDLFKYFPNKLDDITYDKILNVITYDKTIFENDEYLQNLLNAYLETHIDNGINKIFQQHLIEVFEMQKELIDNENLEDKINIIKQTLKVSQPNCEI